MVFGRRRRSCRLARKTGASAEAMGSLRARRLDEVDGFSWPDHGNSANGRHHANIVKQNEIQQDDHGASYNPPRSPGFHDDFGS